MMREVMLAVLDSAMMGQSAEGAAIRLAYEAFFEAYGELSIDREHVLVDSERGRHDRDAIAAEPRSPPRPRTFRRRG